MKIDQQRSVKTADSDGFLYYDVKESPFVIGGISNPSENYGEYYRLYADKKDIYSDQNRFLAACTAGGCVRFATDAEKISIRIKLRFAIVGMHHFCDRGVFGIDAYVGSGTDRKYIGFPMQTFADSPELNIGSVNLPAGENEVQINMPLYSGVESLEIGIPEGASLSAPSKRRNKAVAFYGSSITQGGCVSRPASAYTHIVCRRLDADCYNYGFSGSAMGEIPVAEHIASRELSCFVMDYDYNSPSLEHLKATHEPFFKRIREIQPNLPIVIVTHPYFAEPTEIDKKRIEIVRETYENAVASGDKNVYFVDSSEFFSEEMRDLYAVDFLHPNDLGHFSMAEAIYPVVKNAILNN